MILMRMRDAVGQLQGRGERVHRSCWVARDAVVATLRNGRNLSLRLCDGREVPVARANVATLRAQGWLAGPQDNA
jgi:DNA-binding LytR/AlgR family response regulator